MRRELPRSLVEAAERDGRADWLARLPGTVADLEHRWHVRAEAPFQPGGHTSWVAPAGPGRVMKVAWRHPEAEGEADGSLPDSAPRQVLLCTDLHAGNVLAAEREPWLVIDPKPHIGDPTYDVLQHLLNCEVRLRHDPAGAIARMADLADLDRHRLRQWLFARCVQASVGRPALLAIARRIAP